MLNLLYVISSCYLAVIMAISGIAKLREHVLIPSSVFSSDNVHKENLLIKIAKTQEFAWCSLFLSATFLVLQNKFALAVASALVLVIVLVGGYIDVKHPNFKCACFGTTFGLDKKEKFIVRFLAMTSAIYIIIGSDMKRNLWFYGQGGVSLFVISIILLYFYWSITKREKDKAPSRKLLPDKDFTVWQSSQFLGFNSNNEKVFLSDFSHHRPLIFIIALTNNCPHCSMLLFDLETLLQAFRDRVTIVLLFQGQREDVKSNFSTVLFDPEKNLYSILKAEGSPFALLLDSSTLKQVGPVSYGADKVRILFALTLNLMHRRNFHA